MGVISEAHVVNVIKVLRCWFNLQTQELIKSYNIGSQKQIVTLYLHKYIVSHIGSQKQIVMLYLHEYIVSLQIDVLDNIATITDFCNKCHMFVVD